MYRGSFLILYSPIILKKEKINSFLISVSIAVICFLTYASVYAFRKPFTIGLYLDEPKIFGVDYKNILVIAQVLGYTISKFYCIKFIEELKKLALYKMGSSFLEYDK